MSGWRSDGPRPGTPDEVLGEDDASSSTGRRWGAAVLAVAALATAFALGVESRGTSVAGVSLGEEPPTLAAGALQAASSSRGAAGFSLPVHNPGTATVEVHVAAVPGLELLRGVPRTRVPAGGWADVPFAARVDCSSSPLGPRTATLRTGTGDSVEVDLVEQSAVVPDLHDARCAPRRSLTPARLAGVWLVERAFGRWAALAGRHVLLFRRDGSLVADPEGVRFTSHRGVLGRYRLRGPLLDAVEQGFVGYACLPGDRAVWRAGQLRDGRVVLEFVRGRNCPDQPGELWVLRRLAR